MPTGSDLRGALDDGRLLRGAWILSMSPRVAEALSMSGLDWLGIDMEHAPVDRGTAEALVRAAERGDAAPLVRLPSIDAGVDGLCKTVLDAGAAGLIVPGVEDPDDIERLRAAACYPPDGHRGSAGTTRANRYGDAFQDYIARANADLFIVVQIESEAAVNRVGEILDADGIDVAFIGENDLSTDLGIPGQKDHERVVEAVEAVQTAADRYGIAPGIAARSPDRLRTRIDRGFQFFLLGGDIPLLTAQVESYLAVDP